MSWFAKSLKDAAFAALSAAASKFVGALSSKFIKLVLFIIGIILLGFFIF